MEQLRQQAPRATFNQHMSYAELSRALSLACEELRLLSQSELKCLELSLTDPFLKKMLEIYPLSKKSKKLVTDSLDHQEVAQRGQLDRERARDVHSAIYGGQRERTARYLQQNYPSNNQASLVDKVESFLERMLQNQDAKNELTIAEAERYALRQKEHAAMRLRVLMPLQSFEQIESDFRCYMEYLRKLYEARGSYAWPILEALFQRLAILDVNEEREEAALLLLRALDDSRTAYHDKSEQFFSGKDYTCPKGLEERLLDHHALVVPHQKATYDVDLLEQTILTLTEPFILRDSVDETLSCSQALYQLYLYAAGYELCERSENYFELMPGVDIMTLKEQYQCLFAEDRRLRIRAGYTFQSFMAIIDCTPANQLERDYQGLVAFLREQVGFLRVVQKTQIHLIAPDVSFKPHEIINRMIAQGPFIDRAHLEMALALHNEKASLEVMEHAALTGTAGTGRVFQHSRQDMMHCYQAYRHSQEVLFHHFMPERFSPYNNHRIRCSQAVLSQWLEQHQKELPLERAQKLAVLCAKSGYSSAIGMLCQPGGVSPDYMERQENRSLLLISIQNENLGTVRALISAGADVNQNRDFGQTPLMCAADHGQADIIRELLAADAAVNHQDGDGWTALIYAALHGHIDISRKLVAAGADINLCDNDSVTPIMYAAHHGHIDMVRELITAGADVNLQDRDGAFALLEASQHGYVDIVRVLVSEGARVNLQDKEGWTPLMTSAQNGHSDIVRELISASADVNLKSSDGCTALIYAVHNGATDIIRDLIAVFADVSLCDNDSVTPMMYAAQSGHLDIVRELIAAGACANDQDGDGWTALIYAAHQGHMDISSKLVAAGVDVNLCDNDGVTALMHAAHHGHTDIVKELIAAGADLNLQDTDGESALIDSVKGGYCDIVRVLIAATASVNLKDNKGQTALIYAVSHTQTDIVRELILAGADVSLCDNDSMTPLMYAVQSGHLDIVRELIAAGACMNDQDGEGWTALMHAAQSGHIDIVKELIAAGSCVNNQDGNGWSALMHATHHGYTDIVTELIAAGADVNLQDIDRESALIDSVKRGYCDLVRVLIAASASVNLKDYSGQTALMYAVSHAQTDIARELILAGADVSLCDRNGETVLMIAERLCNQDMIELLNLAKHIEQTDSVFVASEREPVVLSRAEGVLAPERERVIRRT